MARVGLDRDGSAELEAHLRDVGADRGGLAPAGQRTCAAPATIAVAAVSRVHVVREVGERKERVERRDLLPVAVVAAQRDEPTSALDPGSERRDLGGGKLPE